MESNLNLQAMLWATRKAQARLLPTEDVANALDFEEAVGSYTLLDIGLSLAIATFVPELFGRRCVTLNDKPSRFREIRQPT